MLKNKQNGNEISRNIFKIELFIVAQTECIEINSNSRNSSFLANKFVHTKSTQRRFFPSTSFPLDFEFA